MRLYFCEKPSQARDLAAVLGVVSKHKTHIEVKDGVVSWAVGHLLQQAEPDQYKDEWKAWRLSDLPIFPTDWKMIINDSTKSQLLYFKTALKKASEVVIATDIDREGESICREVLDYYNFNGRLLRLWTSDQTPEAYKKALSVLKKGSETEDLYYSQIARSRADWLVGMNLTRAFTKISRHLSSDFSGVASLGRVQTPVLNLVVQRDLEIDDFVPKDYFEVIVNTQVEKGAFKCKWIVPDHIKDEDGRCLDQSVAKKLADRLEGATGSIYRSKTERKTTSAPLPYSLSALQKETSSKFGMSAKATLDTVQKLYETYKAVSYPRSDCRYLPLEQFSDVSKVLSAIKQTDSSLANIVDKANPSLKSKCWNDKKVSAHHAIIPTSAVVSMSGWSDSEKKVYNLIRRSYIAQFYPAYEYDRTTIIVNYEDQFFAASGNVPKVAGWKAVYGMEADDSDGDDDNAILPPTREGEKAEAISADVVGKKTTPPSHFTDGTLIDVMINIHRVVDKVYASILKLAEGIGTEATRAGLIETLLKRNFIERKKIKGKSYLVSTNEGKELIKIAPEVIKSPVTTAIWEMGLNKIASGELKHDRFEAEVKDLVSKIINDIKAQYDSDALDKPGSADEERSDCPACGGKETAKLIYLKKNQEHKWKCESCDKWMDDSDEGPVKPIEKPQRTVIESEEDCPKCKKSKLVLRYSKRGAFWGCATFPKCKAMFRDNNGTPVLD